MDSVYSSRLNQGLGWVPALRRKKIFAAIAILAVASVGEDCRTRAASPIDVGSRKQLFVDELFFSTSKGVTLKIRSPRKTGDVILKPGHPWERATLNWFNVIQDRGRIDVNAKYRMWYEAYDVDGWPTGDDTSFCYAESRDGTHWTKPHLGLFSYKNSTRNNILFRQIGSAAQGNHSRVHGAGVFVDPHAPPHARYKAVSQGIFARLGKHSYRIAGMYSADGLKWTRYPQPICNLFADSQYSGFWDRALGKYVLYGRVSARGRALGRSASGDFTHFDPLKLVLQSDDKDPPNSDLYNSAAIKYSYADNIYLMFPSLYQHSTDTLDIHLAVSRDGIRWSRPDRKTPWIALGNPDEFDGGSLYMGHGMIRVGDELWLYYSGSRLRHNQAKLANLIKPRNARIYSRVVTRLDRFVAATAGADGGFFTTPLLSFTGKTLQLNLNVHPGGRVRVGLLDEQGRTIPGYSVKDCRPIAGDSVSIRVTWTRGSDVSFREKKPTRLRVDMTRAELYSFQVVSTNAKTNSQQRKMGP